jgi:hypothetical protein
VLHPAEVERIADVGLIEDARAIGVVVVARQRDRIESADAGDRTRKDVLVELIVTRKDRLVADLYELR